MCRLASCTVEPLYKVHHNFFAFMEGWPYLRGGFVLKEHILDSMKCPLYRGGLIRDGLYEGFMVGIWDSYVAITKMLLHEAMHVHTKKLSDTYHSENIIQRRCATYINVFQIMEAS